jgi:hypothetical protein
MDEETWRDVCAEDVGLEDTEIVILSRRAPTQAGWSPPPRPPARSTRARRAERFRAITASQLK